MKSCGACPTYIKGSCLGCEQEHTTGDCFTRDCLKEKNEYIKKIVVYATEKSSGRRQQKVKIYFSFVDDVEVLVISEPMIAQTTYERRKTA